MFKVSTPANIFVLISVKTIFPAMPPLPPPAPLVAERQPPAPPPPPPTANKNNLFAFGGM